MSESCLDESISKSQNSELNSAWSLKIVITEY